MSPLLANAAWPALFLEEKILTVPAIGVGLAIEILVLRLALGVAWLRAVVTGLVMNAASTLLGILVIPFTGLLWEGVWESFGTNGFLGGVWVQAAYWGAMTALASLANTVIETPIASWVGRVPVRTRVVGWLLTANAVSVGLALLLMFIPPNDLGGMFPLWR